MLLGIPQLDKFFAGIKQTRLDDFVDRCNYYYTMLALLFAALLIGSKQHFGEPIRCLVDQQYSASWVSYVHDYCFVMDHYSFMVPQGESFDGNTPLQTFGNYYQWVPYLLAVEALAFFAPHFLWRSLQSLSGFDMVMAIEEAVRIRPLSGEKREAALKELSKFADLYLNPPRRAMPSFWCCCLRSSCSSLLYVFSKFLNVGNICLQLYIIAYFVGDGEPLWGFQLAKDLLSGKDWRSTGHFPRVVLCDYERVELGSTQHKTVQCALAINVLNEKLFVLLSGWLWILLVLTAANAMFICIALLFRTFRINFVKSFTEIADVSRIHEKYCSEGGSCGNNRRCHYEAVRSAVSTFVMERLSADGVLFLRFVRSHAGALTARDVARALFESFVGSEAANSRTPYPAILRALGKLPSGVEETAALKKSPDFGVNTYAKFVPAEVPTLKSPPSGSRVHSQVVASAVRQTLASISIFADGQSSGESASSESSDRVSDGLRGNSMSSGGYSASSVSSKSSSDFAGKFLPRF